MTAKFEDLQPLKRFSSRAGDYRNRAGYAPALLDYLREEYGLASSYNLADVGAGTGFLTRVLLQSGCRVHAVEPNAEMRAVAEAELGENPNFISLAGQAEQLPLADASMDALTVGQALHWFQIEEAREEFLRVLKPGGWLAVVDNREIEDANDLERGIEDVIRRYFVSIGKADEPPLRVVRLFEGMEMRTARFANSWQCGRETFIRALLNSSLAPEPGSEGYLQAAAELGALFAFHAEGGFLTRKLETVVYSARLPNWYRQLHVHRTRTNCSGKLSDDIMKTPIISTFKGKPKTKIGWWAMGLGLATILSGPFLVFFTAVIRPLLLQVFTEDASGAFGLNLGLFSLLVCLVAIVVGIVALCKGERSWVVWLGFIPALLSGVFWFFMFGGELLFPH